MSNTQKDSGWRRERGNLLYALSVEELEGVSSLFNDPAEALNERAAAGPTLNAARFEAAGGGGGRPGAIHRMLSALVDKVHDQPGEWREACFDGEPVGFDPVSLTQAADCFFYLPQAAGGLTPGFRGDPEPTPFISCKVISPASAQEMPEAMRLDLAAYMAMLEGRLRVVCRVRPGRAFLPSGEPITPLRLSLEGGCFLSRMEGVDCSPGAAKAVNAALSQMGFGAIEAPWPSLKEVATAAYRWDADRGIERVNHWDEEGPGERFYCSSFVDGASSQRVSSFVGGASAQRVDGLTTRHAKRAIEWALRRADRGADIRLGVSSGPRLLESCWRAQGEMGRGGLTQAPHLMSVKELELKRPAPAEARVVKGVSKEFDEAWAEHERNLEAQEENKLKESRLGLNAAPTNVKRRAMGESR